MRGWWNRRTHEEKVLRIKYATDIWTSRHRFVKRENGDVFDVMLRITYAAPLWAWYMEGERWPSAMHRFQWTHERVEESARDFLPLMHSRCVYCGDERMIYMALDPTDLHEFWCVLRR